MSTALSTGISGPSSYPSVMAAFDQHWLTGLTKIAPATLVLTLPDNTAMSQVQFAALRTTLVNQQDGVQMALTVVAVARGNVHVQKIALLKKINLFISAMDASYKATGFYAARPYAPGLLEGKENFCRALGKALDVWELMNGGPAPAGVTLPLVLGDGTTQAEFASMISALAFTYLDLEKKEVILAVARGDRNVSQVRAYAAMLAYREAAPNKYALHPEMIESLPRLTPLPGHTPQRVNVSAVFEAPDKAYVVYDASTDAALERYELRGNAGEEYSDEDAVVLGTNLPNAPRDFTTTLGLGQPGAKVALKVFVILTTGNEAGSASIIVQRPLAQAA